MINKISDGTRISYTNSSGSTITSGSGVLVGAVLYVATADILNGEAGILARDGVYNLPKLSTDVVTQGAKLFWDNTNKRLTLTSTSNTFAGFAHSAAGSGVTTVNCCLSMSDAITPTDAASTTIADAGGFTAETDVEGALQEVYQNAVTAQAVIPVSLGAITMEDGTSLTKQATTVAGIAQLADKEQVILIPVDCTSGESLGFTVPVPQDMDDTADITVHVLAGKDADLDALTLGCEVYPCAVGDTANADIQDTAATAITAAASELVFTCGADGVLAAPGTLSVVLALGGTNDGDKVYIYGAWVEYKKKVLTA